MDQRQLNGLDCVGPLADVIAFATGRTRSVDGKSIQDYVGKTKAMTEESGVVGWSYGGNLTVLAMAHAERFPELKWYASFESPFLSPVDGGWGSLREANPFYESATGKIDFERLRYSPDMPLWVWPALGLPRQPDWPHGGLYLDGDGNGTFDRNADYGFWVDVDLGPPLKAFYTPLVTREARDRKVFGNNWPPHIATLDEVEERQSRIDALRYIPIAVERLPRLAILVYESRVGHMTNAADHPHAIAQVNAWLDAHARWVRFNPDAHYVEWIMGKRPSREIQYPAGRKLNRETIRDLVEPVDKDGGPTSEQGMTAAVCELADRTYHNNWMPALPHVLGQKKAPSASSR